MFNIVLVNPAIHGNTGAIGRLCVNTDTRLHLIKPLGFDIDDKAVRRAGLDYWKKLDLHVWESLDEFMSKNDIEGRAHFATTKTDKPYFQTTFKDGDYIFMGSETDGLPQELLAKYSQECITIPMSKEGRSLNLAIATGIVLYKAIEQNFNSFKETM